MSLHDASAYRSGNMSDSARYRTGRSLKTTIYRGGDEQPCAWVPSDPDLAARIVAALNSDQGAEIERLRSALQILAARQCGSFCTEKDKDGNPRHKEMERRCASCIARAVLATP